MATRPATQPVWATDTNISSGPEAGTPTKVTPSAGKQGAGFYPTEDPGAQHFNWLANLIYQWIALFAVLIGTDEELTYQTAKARTIWIPMSEGMKGTATEDWTFGQVTDAESWFTGTTGVQKKLVFDITGYLPSGAVITDVSAFVNPGAGEATSTNRMRLELYSVTMTLSGLTPASIASAYYPTTSDVGDTIALASLSTTVDKSTKTYFVQVTSGNHTNSDAAYAIRVLFNDPGPRNA